MSWRKNTRDQFVDSRHACSRWRNTDHPRLNRVPRVIPTVRVHYGTVFLYLLAGACLVIGIAWAIKEWL